MQEFCEECQDSTRTVVRPAELRDNALLPAALQQRAGDAIYAGLRNGFRVPPSFNTCAGRQSSELKWICLNIGKPYVRLLASIAGELPVAACLHHPYGQLPCARFLTQFSTSMSIQVFCTGGSLWGARALPPRRIAFRAGSMCPEPARSVCCHGLRSEGICPGSLLVPASEGWKWKDYPTAHVGAALPPWSG